MIKTSTSYFIYPLEKTNLNLILNKEYLIKKIYDMNEKKINKNLLILILTKITMKLTFFLIKKLTI